MEASSRASVWAGVASDMDQSAADLFHWLSALIAMPAMGDPRFARSVIYLCAHSADGAMGIIINHALCLI